MVALIEVTITSLMKSPLIEVIVTSPSNEQMVVAIVNNKTNLYSRLIKSTSKLKCYFGLFST